MEETKPEHITLPYVLKYVIWSIQDIIEHLFVFERLVRYKSLGVRDIEQTVDHLALLGILISLFPYFDVSANIPSSIPNEHDGD